MQRTSNIRFGDNVRVRSTPETDALGVAEVIDHAEGTEITLDGVPKKWTRSASGEWVESSQKKPWWKFW